MIHYQSSHRRLAENHSCQLPRYLIAFDCETLPRQTDDHGTRFSHRFRLATATIGRIVGTDAKSIKRYRFSSPNELWIWLKSVTAANYTTWLVSHNALFDLIVAGFMDRLLKAELVIDWPRSKRKAMKPSHRPANGSANCVIESPPTIVACRIADTQARVVMLDSLNWFPVALSAMGERCGLPKLAMPKFSASDEEWFVYCQRDSDILFKTFAELIKWVKDNDFGIFRYTAPSQAMSAYRHRFMGVPIFIHDNMKVKEVERKAYFGGRTEVFKKGSICQSVYQVDVNSLFPSVMLGGHFPHVLDRYEIRDEWLPLLPALDWKASVASVVIDSPEPIFPLRQSGCVIYPIGRFATALCGQELAYAHSKGYIRKIGSWAEYRIAPLFSKWVAELYEKRLDYQRQGDTLYADFTKRLMNSLYGKWGEKAPKWINLHNDFRGTPWSAWVEFDWKTGTPQHYRMFGWQCQRKQEGEETKRSFVAISAFVTAAARMRMNRLRSIAGQANVYYQGVDGLIVTKRGLDNLDRAGEMHADAIGKLRLIKIANEGEIIGCSDYRLGDKVIVAGRSRKVEELADGSVLQRKFYAANALFNGRAATEIAEELQEWKRTAVVRKGTVSVDGWITPFHLSEQPE